MIQHVSFIIADVKRSKHFYIHTLGLEEDTTRPSMGFDGYWVKINEDQQIHLLNVDNPDSSIRPEHGGRDRHVAFLVSNLSDIKEHLKKNEISYSVSKSGRTALFCRDPDGNTLELMEST